MLLSLTIFTFSLLSLSLFFAVKEREAYSGKTYGITRFLRNKSPRAEMIYYSYHDAVTQWGTNVLKVVLVTIRYVLHITKKQTKRGMVHIGHKMIKLAQGEHTLTGAAPSPYAQHVHDSQKRFVKAKVILRD